MDEDLGLTALFVTVPRRDAVYLKAVIESYECMAVVRSVNPRFSPDRALLVLLLAPDFAGDARAVLDDLRSSLEIGFPRTTPAMMSQLRCELLTELEHERPGCLT